MTPVTLRSLSVATSGGSIRVEGMHPHRHRYANFVPVKQPLVTNLYLIYYNNAAKSEVKQQTTIQVLFGLRCLASCYNQKRFLLKMHKKAFRDQARCPGLHMELTALPRSPGLKGEGSAGKGGRVEGSPPTTDSWISHWLGCNRTVEIKAVRNMISDSCSGGSRIFARGVRQLVPLECPLSLRPLRKFRGS